MRYKGTAVIFVLTELLALFVLFYLYQLWYICIQEYDWMKEFIAKRKWHYLFLRPKATAFSLSWDLDEAKAAETICLARHYKFLSGQHSLRPPCLTCKIAFSQQAGPQILSEVLHVLEGSSEGKDRHVSSGNKLSPTHCRVGKNNAQSWKVFTKTQTTLGYTLICSEYIITPVINTCFVDHRDKGWLWWYKILHMFFRKCEGRTKLIDPEKILWGSDKAKPCCFFPDNTTILRTKFYYSAFWKIWVCVFQNKLFYRQDFSTQGGTHSCMYLQFWLFNEKHVSGTGKSFYMAQETPFFIKPYLFWWMVSQNKLGLN